MRRLYRSTTDQKISGVIGGLAEYLELDSTLLRLAWVIITIFTGMVFGILSYFVAVLIMPRQQETAALNRAGSSRKSNTK